MYRQVSSKIVFPFTHPVSACYSSELLSHLYSKIVAVEKGVPQIDDQIQFRWFRHRIFHDLTFIESNL